MKITFGIITNADGGVNDYLKQSIESIVALNIPEYEIIVVGNEKQLSNSFSNIKIIDFNESIKPMWITKKKNLITEHAKYDNIIYSHDYIVYNKDFYSGFVQYGENFKACMVRLENPDGSRFRDWVMFPDNYSSAMRQLTKMHEHETLLPYEETRMSKFQYFSGSWWVAKKDIMKELPLDENLAWGEGEDVLWSQCFRNKYEFSINKFSSVKLLKQKDPVFRLIKPDVYDRLKVYASQAESGQRGWY
jgi:hypothetical protein